MKSEYKREDLGVGVRGKYYEAYKESHNIVLLQPEVVKSVFDRRSCKQSLEILNQGSFKHQLD